MYERFGVVAADARSGVSASRPTTFVAQIGESMMPWKYTQGSWRVAYMSPFLATSVESMAPSSGWRHVFASVAEFPMSS